MRKRNIALLFLLAVLLLSGCGLRTVEEMYSPPRRSAEYEDLQRAIDEAMTGLEYCAPLSGDNQQTVQMADLNGDGQEEYLLFAKGSSEKPLQILIFGREAEEYVLLQRIESFGSAFELVEYVDIDGAAGQELVVGRQVSDQVLRVLSVYHFADAESRQLMTTNYSKFVTSDLDQDEKSELMVIIPGATDADKASAVLYSYEDDTMERSREVSLSAPASRIKRIMVGNLQGGKPAVYVASAMEESAIITDVFAMKNGTFSNVSLSNESGTSVQTLRNYYVYADDIDDDGVLELPDLITMEPYLLTQSTNMQYLIRWYAMDLNGAETDKMYTFHDLAAGWYLELDSSWAERVTVVQESGSYIFYVWHDSREVTDSAYADQLMTIDILTGSDREKIAAEADCILLYRADEALYTAKIEDCAASYGVTPENLADRFHLIFKDWKTGETE